MIKNPGEFTRRVISLTKTIPSGRVTTYGTLAVAAGGHPMLAQMITHLLSKALDAETIPFHRIVYANGRVWLDDKYRQSRLALYHSEGIKLDKSNKIINFEKIIFIPKL